jgi:hypothetical protein
MQACNHFHCRGRTSWPCSLIEPNSASCVVVDAKVLYCHCDEQTTSHISADPLWTREGWRAKKNTG